MKKIRLIEMFAGIGSQASALKRLGVDFEHYRVVEYDKYPIASYNAIHNTNFEPQSITDIQGKDLGIVDTDSFTYLLTYSFPCQDLSVAGQQRGMGKGSGTRSGLLWEVERLLNECDELPQILLMENVTMVHGKGNLEDFQKWMAFLESKGYKNHWKDLNAKDYGIAQNRNRCFMISLLEDIPYHFPEPFPLTKKMKDYLEEEVDEKFYVNSEKAKQLIQKLAENGELPSSMGTGGNQMPMIIDEPKVVGGIGEKKSNNGRQFFQQDRVYSSDGVAMCHPAQLTGGSYKYLVNDYDNYRIRKLTPKECWRLMGFTDEEFKKAEKVNSNTQLYKQAGNSICVNVLEAIFRELILLLEGKSPKYKEGEQMSLFDFI